MHHAHSAAFNPVADYSDPAIEAGLYHSPDRQGYFALAWSTRSGRQRAAYAAKALKGELPLEADSPLAELRQQGKDWAGLLKPELGQGFRQKSFPLADMDRVLSDVSSHVSLDPQDSFETTSFWISQGEFTKPNRQKHNLARIAVCWVDLDLHHPNSAPTLHALNRDTALDKALATCTARGIPTPSIVLWTGRGLALKWLTEVLPRAAYPRWAAVQKALVEAFNDLGADDSARDASRILRIPGTYNPKSAQQCVPIYANTFFGEIVRYSFDDLADAVLPITREQLHILRRQRTAAQQEKARRIEHHLKVLESERKAPGCDNLRPFNPVRLAWLQVDDFRRLAALRPPTVRPQGWTNSLVWMASSALAVAVWADADRWKKELPSFATELAPHWTPSRIQQATASVLARMNEMAKGQWVEYKGKKRPPVYTPKHQTILDTLGVTDDEAQQLAVILSPAVREEREKARQAAHRRLRGELERAAYLEAKQEKREQARVMREQGATWAQVAERLGYASGESARIACNRG